MGNWGFQRCELPLLFVQGSLTAAGGTVVTSSDMNSACCCASMPESPRLILSFIFDGTLDSYASTLIGSDSEACSELLFILAIGGCNTTSKLSCKGLLPSEGEDWTVISILQAAGWSFHERHTEEGNIYTYQAYCLLVWGHSSWRLKRLSSSSLLWDGMLICLSCTSTHSHTFPLHYYELRPQFECVLPGKTHYWHYHVY